MAHIFSLTKHHGHTHLPAKLDAYYRHVMNVICIWIDASAPAMGAAVAFYTIFAIAPLFILVLALAGFIFGHSAAESGLYGQIQGLVGAKGAQAIQSILTAASRPRTGLLATIIGFIALFIGASSVFIQLQQALNSIWNVRPKAGGVRSFVKHRLLSFATLLAIGFLLLVSLSVSAALDAAGKWITSFTTGYVIFCHLIDWAISLGIITLLFAMIFKILPDVIITWRNVWIGSFITALLFTAGKYLLGAYLGRTGFTSAYGAAGSFVVVLLWVYYSAQILLLGAASIRVYAKEHGSQIQPAPNAEFVRDEPH